ncbi:MAG TPA: Ig-like domain-containing protein [Puia sp.]
MKRSLWLLSAILIACAGKLQAQTAKFNFSLAAQSVGSGWVNVPGDPSTGVRSGTSNGISVSSVATANWAPLAGTGAAFDNIGSAGGTFFSPSTVTLNHWFQYSSPAGYNELVPQLQVSGLIKDSVYTLAMTASSTSTRNTNPTRYTVVGRTVFGYIDVNTHNNTALGATFNNVLPDENGMIKIYVNTLPTTQVADISGLQVTMGRTNPPPVVQITSPDDNDVLDDEHPLVINATASETSGTISKVMFYIGDTTKIGESTTAPYTATWSNPDPGQYKLTAVAVDAQGVSNSYSITVNIEAKSSSWSTTGNIATGGDTSFIGTVDTNRLAFRTNNIERMSILGDGTIGIGTKNTYGYKLAVNGNAIFGKVRIKTVGSWPDYVFKKGYPLKSLEDLESYVDRYQHLPGIIPESIANGEGVDLGTHQAALLKKVEELTLYLIRENKALKEQNQRIAGQNIKLEDQQRQIDQQQRQIDEMKRMIKEK